MKNKIIKKIIFIFVILILIILSNKVYAVDLALNTASTTEEYQRYLELSDEEKTKVLKPKKYDVVNPKTNAQYLKGINNLFKTSALLTNSLEDTYDLRNIIPNNVVIRNQMSTNTCWAFAAIGTLESNLAMLDYKAARQSEIYDFSERHMSYASRRAAFNNNEINEYGYSMEIQGGNFQIAQNYLVNGMGAISEEEMPFENNEDNINLSDIQNKEVTTTLYDTIEFPDPDDVERTELISKIKETISNYGGVFAGVHGASLSSDSYNNKTGAIYCNSDTTYPMDHAVVIIGWDDNYSVDNFNEISRPNNNGAWIVKNSWGSEITISIQEEKESLYNNATDACIQNGWTTPDLIPDDYIIDSYIAEYGEEKTSVDGDNIAIQVGDNGYMYISYEDENIYNQLNAIEKSTNSKDYDNLYQNDKILADTVINAQSDEEIYVANKFDREASNNEKIDKVSFYTLQEVTCNIYVNPNNGNLDSSSLQLVEENINIQPGYHIIELENPIRLTGDEFAVVFSIDSDSNELSFMLETTATDENVEVNEDESFYTTKAGFEVNDWVDLATYEDPAVRGNLSIKAFTQNVEPLVLENIEITTPPTKVEYTEGESFDSSGLIVTAIYNDGTTSVVNDYEIIDGDNLSIDQNSITIRYEENGVEKTVAQNIVVSERNEQNPEPTDRPVLSDFSNKYIQLQGADIYIYSDSDIPRIVMDINISNVIKGNNETNYTYYFHFGATDSEQNINDWTQIQNINITENSDGTRTLSFSISSDQIPNFNELLDADELYLYIKEEASLNGEVLEQVIVDTIDQTENSELNIYFDDEQIGSIDDVVNIEGNNQNSGQNFVDNTVVEGKLPQAGVISLGIVIFVLIGFGVFTFIKHRNIDK